jgi:hypothetical protein
MKKCIWCSQTAEKANFKKLAHTIPQSLGGKHVCLNVCDDCNLYFGSYNDQLPPIETIIKETFNISRYRFLDTHGEVGKNKPMAKFSSIFFDINVKKRNFKIKSKYRYYSHFQESILRQLKRGLYKIFLEEIERQTYVGHNAQYDFIREFSRYNLGDLPLFYFERRHPLIHLSISSIKNPEFFIEKEMRSNYLVEEPSFFEFELLGHVFGIATSKHWNLVFDNYIEKTCKSKKELFKSIKRVKNFNEIDLALSILDVK